MDIYKHRKEVCHLLCVTSQLENKLHFGGTLSTVTVMYLLQFQSHFHDRLLGSFFSASPLTQFYF